LIDRSTGHTIRGLRYLGNILDINYVSNQITVTLTGAVDNSGAEAVEEIAADGRKPGRGVAVLTNKLTDPRSSESSVRSVFAARPWLSQRKFRVLQRDLVVVSADG
jgi:hypothetical protein